MHHTLFISDLHLEAERPRVAQLFLRFLKQQAYQADALYILGDFFEVWMGDDDHNLFNETIIKSLEDLSQRGVPIYFMPGNRDFLIGQRFLNATGAQLLRDPTRINLYGTPVLLMHGDSLCTLDVKHQRFRRWSQNFVSKKLFLMIPLSWRKKIALKMRNLSKKHTQTIKDYIMDVTPAAVNRVMQRYQVTQLIHGHTHRPDIHIFDLNGQSVKRMVLGAWHEQGSALIYREDGSFTLHSISE